MADKSNKKLFKAERENTDTSLTAERAKATRSLNTANGKSQDQTDEIVKDERYIADQRTAASRAHHDEKSGANVQLTKERIQTDRATVLERSKMDLAMTAERESTSKLVARVFEQERIATDRSLLVERTTTDEEFVDTTNLLQSEVARHKKTQVALTSREEFLAIVSHDLRNPIGAVSSYADLILEGSGDTELGPETTKFMQAIKRNADISLRLISDLLDLERISEDKLKMNFSNCDAREIANAAIGIFTPLASERNITLLAELPKGPLELQCDHDRILQAVSNLIANALKFTTEGGKICLSVKIDGPMVEFAVKDNGCGIPKEKQTEIFKRFAQLSSSDRTGLGLGLYIAKTIVEYHSGQLSVDSEVGKGSKFYFSIPETNVGYALVSE